MRSTNDRVVAVDGFEILQELITGIEKTRIFDSTGNLRTGVVLEVKKAGGSHH